MRFVQKNWLPLAVMGLALLGTMHGAHAATAGGGNMPWDTPLTNFRNDLTGPTAFTLALLAFFVCGAMLVFGHEIDAFVRKLMIVVMVAAFLVGVQNVAAAFGIAGALV